MPRKLPIFYSALLLTGVNLLLRLVGTSFQVYLSSRIGAEGIGLLQLVMSVGAMALVAGMAGIRTATMYLTAEEIGKKRPQNLTWVLSGCLLYSILCSTAIAAAIAAMEGGSNYKLRSLTRKKDSRNPWGVAATLSYTQPF